MTDKTEILNRLLEAWATPTIRPADHDDSFIVDVPSLRHEHDFISFVVERHDDELWSISDGGAAQWLLGEAFASAAELAIEAGAGFTVAGSDLVTLSTLDNLAQAVLHAADDHLSLTSIQHAIQALEERQIARNRAVSASTQMAREMRGALTAVAPRVAPLITLGRPIVYKSLRTKASMAINDPRGVAVPPQMIASFVDFSVSERATSFALQSTAYAMDVAEKVPVERRFIVVRGDEQHADDVATMYDKRQATVVRTEDPAVIYGTVAEMERELAALTSGG